jgi:8-oxo-dGTP diphosphatase
MKLAVDLVVYRNGDVLFVKRKFPPFEGQLALPGGFVEDNETVEMAAVRELYEETSVMAHPSKLKLLGVPSEPGRDPRGRVVSVAFLVRVPKATKATAGDDAAETIWLPLDQALETDLAFDHSSILSDASWKI